MNKLSPAKLLVAAALFATTAESAWSQEETSSVPAASAGQTSSTGTGAVPGYAPTPYSHGYERYWQPPPPPPPPPGYYGQYDPYYPPYRQSRSEPAAPAENPLSAELKQTQEQLAAKTSELNTANEQLATLQAEQEVTRQALQQAQSESVLDSEQLSVVMEQMDILYDVLSELKARLDEQNTRLLGALQADAENSEVDSDVGSKAEQAQSPATTLAQPENAGSAEIEVVDKEQASPEAEQENQ